MAFELNDFNVYQANVMGGASRGAKNIVRDLRSGNSLDSDFKKMSRDLTAGQERVKGLLDKYDAIYADKEFDFTVTDFTAPFTEAFEATAKTLENKFLAEGEEAQEKVQAFVAGSKETRPFVKAEALRRATSDINRQYTTHIAELNNQNAANLATATQAFAGLKSQFDLGVMDQRTRTMGILIGAEVSLLGTAAQYAASIAGTQAQRYQAELALAGQVYSSLASAGSALAVQSLRGEQALDQIRTSADEDFYSRDYFTDLGRQFALEDRELDTRLYETSQAYLQIAADQARKYQENNPASNAAWDAIRKMSQVTGPSGAVNRGVISN